MFHRMFAMQAIVLRYFGVYGPRMAEEGAYMLAIAAFLRARREGRALEIHGDGQQTRDFSYVADTVSGTKAASELAGTGQLFNLGGGSPASLRDAIDTRAPSSAKARAQANPMPLLPPVMKTTFPSKPSFIYRYPFGVSENVTQS